MSSNNLNYEKIPLIPIEYLCDYCGKIFHQGLVKAFSWPVQKGDLCPKCKEKLGRTTTWTNGDTTLTKTVYPPTQHVLWSGECSLCKCFPCGHVYQNKSGGWKLV